MARHYAYTLLMSLHAHQKCLFLYTESIQARISKLSGITTSLSSSTFRQLKAFLIVNNIVEVLQDSAGRKGSFLIVKDRSLLRILGLSEENYTIARSTFFRKRQRASTNDTTLNNPINVGYVQPTDNVSNLKSNAMISTPSISKLTSNLKETTSDELKNQTGRSRDKRKLEINDSIKYVYEKFGDMDPTARSQIIDSNPTLKNFIIKNNVNFEARQTNSSPKDKAHK